MSQQNKKMQLLGNAPIPQALLAMGIPTMIGMLVNALYNLVDAYFVGGLGESQMGAISVVYPLGQVVVGLGLLFGNGAASYISRLLGRNDKEKANQVVSTALSSIFPTLGSGLANALSGTSYASEDTDLLGVDEDYTALENELAQTVANIESTHPGYDEYRYSVDEIGHNPYELASYLSAKYHVYFREQVQDELREIFEAQYELTLTEEVEIRYRTETSTDPETGETTTEEVPYEYYILNVTLTNKTLPAVILTRLNEQQREIYTVMQQLKGNKPYLWEGIYNGGEDTGPSYEIPGEALDDPAFAALMEEATKYIGWPYVWGGSSPSTSFDCSGFVCWVYTASGVHNLPRTTAQGIYNQCAIISHSEAKPGDIIFFTGTYDSPGPVSHVGIYVGDGMMLHCGSPIQYANINSSYWQTHFYAFGRL